MVIRLGRAGRSRLGCLLTILVLAAGTYYGVNIGEVWVRYFRLVEEMRSQARLAPGITNGVIRRRVYSRMESLSLPPEARTNLVVRRLPNPRRIEIRSEYQETVDLPLLNHTFTFRPRAEAPL